MTLDLEPFTLQQDRWPRSGRCILANFDPHSIVVYQAFRPAIAHDAVAHQRFGGEFRLTRMSWIKPNFLWMMFRSGWATKEDQESVLAVRIRLPAFLAILAASVHSKYVESIYSTPAAWKERARSSDVRLQWDPDHDPSGKPLERRAIQLGLAGETLRAYATVDVVSIEDITPFVHAQREHARRREYDRLMLPREEPLAIADPKLRLHLGIDDVGGG
jgi:hypothetical protein